jgi:hypothetical protein
MGNLINISYSLEIVNLFGYKANLCDLKCRSKVSSLIYLGSPISYMLYNPFSLAGLGATLAI